MQQRQSRIFVAVSTLVAVALLLVACAATGGAAAAATSSTSASADATATRRGTMARIRGVLDAMRAVGEGLEKVFPALSTTAGSALYEAGHLPAKILTGATARGARTTLASPLMPAEESDPAEAEQQIAELVNGAVQWYTGSPDGQNGGGSSATSTTDSDTSTASVKHADIDALSRLHLRAAEASAEARRSSRGFAAQAASHTDVLDRAAAEASSVAHAYAADIVGDAAEIESAIDARSHQRLVRLLKWRREQREHHQRPHIRPEYLPHYAKRFSGHPEAPPLPPSAATHRSFAAQQAFALPTYQYCHDGLVAIPGTVNFTCTNGGVTRNLTAAQVAAEPPVVRSNCTALRPTRACICPRDSIPGRTVFGDVVCFWKELECTVERVSPATCPAQPIFEPQRIQQCITVPRASNLTLAVNVSCAFKWADPRDYAFFGIDLLPIPADTDTTPTYLVLNTTNRTVDIIVNLTDAPFAPYGTYKQISDAVFIYTAEPATSIMPLTEVHPVVGGIEFFVRPVNFNRVADRRYQSGWKVGSPQYVAGQLVGRSPVSFNVDLSNVSASFVHGNRLFIEAGLRGGISTVSVIAAPFTIDFTDLPVPPLRSETDNTTLIVVLATVIPAVVIGAIIAALCTWRWHSNKKRKERAAAKRDDKQD